MEIRVGVDLVHVPRLRRLLAEQPAIGGELFTPGELRACADRRNTVSRLSARFAAKEAVLKALGTGLGPRMRWLDVEIANEPWGRPVVRLHGAAAAAGARLGARSVDVSLSHTGDFALAHAVVVTSGGDDEEEE
ncbi:holo-ACP synthase [Kribbella albertanoniae]|uniref:Holo-[acyl-carrier-protein] synthase n=1 Tax=Kribbella albertanoniae TaxID=1266829 RepID=A0A4R4QDW6_9ACTN|nr:holo-ACP synthase [Kribbella albertanoniae]TDC33668.1 holo-[acyl-carrier-protein] synthase [Kribbella albertanoniae]